MHIAQSFEQVTVVLGDLRCFGGDDELWGHRESGGEDLPETDKFRRVVETTVDFFVGIGGLIEESAGAGRADDQIPPACPDASNGRKGGGFADHESASRSRIGRQ